MKRIYLDANVILRFVLADVKEQYERSAALFESSESGQCMLIVPPEILAEVIYVLRSFYDVSVGEVSQLMMQLAKHPGLQFSEDAVMRLALEHYAKTGNDIADCLLAARSNTTGNAVASFDKDFRKFESVDMLKF